MIGFKMDFFFILLPLTYRWLCESIGNDYIQNGFLFYLILLTHRWLCESFCNDYIINGYPFPSQVVVCQLAMVDSVIEKLLVFITFDSDMAVRVMW